MIPTLLAGLGTGLSLIVAIGAQNAYVLRQGIRRAHIGTVVLICAAADLVLILAGVAGVGAAVEQTEGLLVLVRWFGVAFLLWYAVGSLRRVARPASLESPDASRPGESRAAVAGRAAALTWLNPHVYLDTVLLLGSVAASHDGDPAGGRWWFALGACSASVLWFCGLGFGARRLAPVLHSAAAWRILELLIAATMIYVAARLAVS